MWIVAVLVMAPPPGVFLEFRPDLGDRIVLDHTYRFFEEGYEALSLTERVDWLLQQRDSRGNTVSRWRVTPGRMVADGQVIRPNASSAPSEYFERRAENGRLITRESDPNYGSVPERLARLVTPIYPAKALKPGGKFSVQYQRGELPGVKATYTMDSWTPTESPRLGTLSVVAEEQEGKFRIRLTGKLTIDLGNGVVRSMEAKATNVPIFGGEDGAMSELQWTMKYVTDKMRRQKPRFSGAPAK